MADLRGRFKKPFKEQLAALRLRMGDLVPTKRWDDMTRAAHDRAFMVAGAMKADLLADLAGAIEKSVAKGGTLESFRKDFDKIVEKHGWHGWTGEESKKRRAWRTRIIYQTNMMTSYHAGRYAQLKEGKFTYWIYRHGGALEPRQHHLSWDGLILKAGHPFWKTHYPPNGWGCSCYVNGARDMKAARRRGGKSNIKLPRNWQTRIAKTGAPAGIDKNWDYAPGGSVSDVVRAIAPKIEKLPAPIGKDLLQEWLDSAVFGRWFEKPQGFWPMARLDDEVQAQIGVQTRLVSLSRYTLNKQKVRHPDLGLFDYRKIEAILANPLEIIKSKSKENNSWVVIGPKDSPDGRKYRLVVKIVHEMGEIFISSFHRI